MFIPAGINHKVFLELSILIRRFDGPTVESLYGDLLINLEVIHHSILYAICMDRRESLSRALNLLHFIDLSRAIDIT
jgi:hypothetical protein